MKTRKIMALAVSATLALAGCSNNDEPSLNEVQGQPMQFSAVINHTQNTHTRAAHADAKHLADFGVTVQKVGDTENAAYPTASYNNIKFTANDATNATAWTPASNLLWQKGKHTVNILAYAPYNTDETLKSTDLFAKTDFPVSVENSQTTSSYQSDLLICKIADHNPITTPNATLAFSHALSQLVVEVTCPAEFTPDMLSKVTSLTLGGTKLSGTCDFTKASGYVTASATDAAAPITVAKSATDGQKLTFTAVVIPQTVASGALTLNFQIDGWDFNWASTADYTFAENNSYKITLTAGANKAPTPGMSTTALKVHSALKATPWAVNQ